MRTLIVLIALAAFLSGGRAAQTYNPATGCRTTSTARAAVSNCPWGIERTGSAKWDMGPVSHRHHRVKRGVK